MKNNLNELQDSVVKFRDEREWKQFHNPKDTSLSLVLEAAELMEHFQWKNAEEIEAYLKTNKSDVAEELSDVLYWVLLIAHDLNIDLPKAFKAKLKKNGEKYPVAKSKGKHTKYTKL
jgi:dCTP diphosphatase